MDNTGVIFIFITNSPRGIPDAVRSRCSEQIYIGFPSPDNIRESIINKLNRVGRVRYNFNIHYVDGKDKEGKPTKVIRKQW
jgi:AAA+ superfamily predicted ATPase